MHRWVVDDAGPQAFDDPVIETVCTLMTPYGVHLRESIDCSGVLACVCSGLLVRSRAIELFSAPTRLHATAVFWESVVFVLTGLTFIFIGLGLRSVVVSISSESNLGPYSFNHVGGSRGYGRSSSRLDISFSMAPSAVDSRAESSRSRTACRPFAHDWMDRDARGCFAGCRHGIAKRFSVSQSNSFRRVWRHSRDPCHSGDIPPFPCAHSRTRWRRAIAGTEQEIDARLALLAEANVFWKCNNPRACQPKRSIYCGRTFVRNPTLGFLAWDLRRKED